MRDREEKTKRERGDTQENTASACNKERRHQFSIRLFSSSMALFKIR
jgi:hypothetical protein